MEEKFDLAVSVYPQLCDMSDRIDHDIERKAHLWEQFGWTLNAAVECCAFITLDDGSLLLAV